MQWEIVYRWLDIDHFQTFYYNVQKSSTAELLEPSGELIEFES